jgi:RNA polymerase sigma-70 factor (sigma-E family)
VGGWATEELDAEFVAFVDRRARQHLRAAALLTGDWHTAEDLVQTCLVKLYRAWPRLDPSVDLDAYLLRMLVNTNRSWWRARWRREAPVATVPDRAGEVDGQDAHDRAAAVRQALRALPARQRAVLVLRFYEDLPVAEVADLLGCSAGAVRRIPTAASAGSGSSWPERLPSAARRSTMDHDADWEAGGAPRGGRAEDQAVK